MSHFQDLIKAKLMAVAQRKEEESNAPQENDDEDGRITFDDTSEFVRNVNTQSLAAPVKRERAASPQAPEAVVVKIERGDDGDAAEAGDGDEDMDMDSEDEDEALAEIAAREGLSLEEYRLKIDGQMKEIEEIKAEQVSLYITAVLVSVVTDFRNQRKKQSSEAVSPVHLPYSVNREPSKFRLQKMQSANVFNGKKTFGSQITDGEWRNASWQRFKREAKTRIKLSANGKRERGNSRRSGMQWRGSRRTSRMSTSFTRTNLEEVS